jgi:general secretion pathway protein M
VKQWWLSRSPQDKLALMLGFGALSLLLLYLLFWIPFTQQVENRKMLLDGQKRTLQWMQQQAAEVNRLKQRQNSRNRPGSDEALLTLVDRTAQQNQLRGFIKRLKPDGGSAVQIWVEQAPFDHLIDWLGLLVNQHAILLESVSIERQDKAGIINAKVNLQREAG